MKLLRTLAGLALPAFVAFGCQQVTLGVQVLTPDGADPFVGPDAATTVRFRLESDTIAPVTANVAPNGGFSLDIEPSPGVVTRGIVEGLRMNEVVASGATPPIEWTGLGPVVLTVFVQRRDSVVESPWPLATARAAPALFEVGVPFVVAIGGSAVSAPIESFNTLTLSFVSNGATFDAAFGREASFVRLADGRVLAVRGCNSVTWNPTTNALVTPAEMNAAPMGRCDIASSAVVQEPGGGGLLLGGLGPTGAVTRADFVMPDGAWTPVSPLATPRVRPAAVRVGPGEALVAGGQSAGTFLERYTRTLAADRRAITTGNAAVDGRTGAALVATSDGVVLALGGGPAGGAELAAEDAVLDTRCLGDGCPVVLGTPALLRERRRDPAAALAEGGRVVVASGSGASGAASAVEVIDASTPRAPAAGVTVGSLPFADLTALTLRTGSVIFAGGGQRTTWMYRH